MERWEREKDNNKSFLLSSALQSGNNFGQFKERRASPRHSNSPGNAASYTNTIKSKYWTMLFHTVLVNRHSKVPTIKQAQCVVELYGVLLSYVYLKRTFPTFFKYNCTVQLKILNLFSKYQEIRFEWMFKCVAV